MGIPESWGEGPGISDFFPRRAGIFFIFFPPGARLRFFFEFSKILGKGNPRRRHPRRPRRRHPRRRPPRRRRRRRSRRRRRRRR